MKITTKKCSFWGIVLLSMFTQRVLAIITPKALVFNQAELVNANLYILAKNNQLYGFNTQTGNLLPQVSKSNVLGIYKKQDTLFAWNNNQVYAHTNWGGWQLIKQIIDNNKVVAVSSVNNEAVIVFSDAIYNVSKKATFRTPISVSKCFGGQSLCLVSANKIVYSFSAQYAFAHHGKLDSAVNIIQLDTQLAYSTQKGVYKYQIVNKQSQYVAPIFKNEKIIATLGNDIVMNTASEVLLLNDDFLKQSILSEKCLSFNVIDTNQVVYTNQNGQCYLYQIQQKTKVALGTSLKAYTIINYIENEQDAMLFSQEGLVFNLNNNSITDISEETNGINEVIKVNHNFVFATNNGLFTLNSLTNQLQLVNGFNNMSFQGLVQHEKNIWACSAQGGIFKFKAQKITQPIRNNLAVNKGLILPSAYLIQKFGNSLFCVSQTGVYKLTNSATKWEEINQSGFIPKISAITYFGKQQKVLLVSSAVRGITKTNDNGLSYESLNYGIDDTSIVHVASDSNGFYILAKSGSMYFHDHKGVQWIKMNVEKMVSFFIKNEILHCIDNQNNITMIPTISLKPEIEIDWQLLDKEYTIGQTISIPFEIRGVYGKNNYTVLQLTKLNTPFDEKYISYSSSERGVLELNLTEKTLKPGEYTLRVVGTEPYVATKKNRFSFTVKNKKTDEVNPEKELAEIIKN